VNLLTKNLETPLALPWKQPDTEVGVDVAESDRRRHGTAEMHERIAAAVQHAQEWHDAGKPTPRWMQDPKPWQHRDPTLDKLGFKNYGGPLSGAAIQWMNENMPGINIIPGAMMFRDEDGNYPIEKLNQVRQLVNPEAIKILNNIRHGLMAEGGHGLPKVSPGPAMPDPSKPCGRATPETA
jgi:hypothetical protein